jgi:TetR/AcrR family transcriptional repressor of nem operon
MSKGAETRQRIVAQAAALFNQHGFEGSSLTALMKATGLEKGGLYRHFSSKEEIAAEAFDYAWKTAVEIRTRELDTIANSVDWLKQSIANFVERSTSVPGGCPLLNTAVDSDDGNPVLRKRVSKALDGWRKRLTKVIKAGIGAKEIQNDVDPKRLATLVISSLEGALMISRVERDREALRAVKSYLHDYLESEVRRRPK